jgi:hypothetical protein
VWKSARPEERNLGRKGFGRGTEPTDWVIGSERGENRTDLIERTECMVSHIFIGRFGFI